MAQAVARALVVDAREQSTTTASRVIHGHEHRVKHLLARISELAVNETALRQDEQRLDIDLQSLNSAIHFIAANKASSSPPTTSSSSGIIENNGCLLRNIKCTFSTELHLHTATTGSCGVASGGPSWPHTIMMAVEISAVTSSQDQVSTLLLLKDTSHWSCKSSFL